MLGHRICSYPCMCKPHVSTNAPVRIVHMCMCILKMCILKMCILDVHASILPVDLRPGLYACMRVLTGATVRWRLCAGFFQRHVQCINGHLALHCHIRGRLLPVRSLHPTP